MRVGIKVAVLIVLCMVMLLSGCGEGTPVQVLINGEELRSVPLPARTNGQVQMPVKELAEALDAEVVYDEAEAKVLVTASTEKGRTEGELYLQGQHESVTQEPDIMRNFISATDLLKILDDDNDQDPCDYRAGHNEGDDMSNDPLVVDVRKKEAYDEEHIPGAVWFAAAADMGRKEFVQELREQLARHTGRGGKNEVVLYCYSGHQSSLVAGVLSTQGICAKSMLYGFDHVWSGLKKFPAPLAQTSLEGQSERCTKPGG